MLSIQSSQQKMQKAQFIKKVKQFLLLICLKETITKGKYDKYVVHCKKSEYDVYIGRKNPSMPQQESYVWGNPFKISDTMDRDAVIRAYREWILKKPELVALAKKELKGKVLACWW